MIKLFLILILPFFSSGILFAQTSPDVDDIIKAVDRNMSAKTTILRSKMIVHGRRATRTISSKSWMKATTLSWAGELTVRTN